jgi:hypothetical protein
MLNVRKVLNGFECDYKDELLEVIDYDFDDNSLNEFIDYLEDSINDSGAIDEVIDRQIDIYYYDLRKWFVDNFDYVDQAIDEFGKAEDIHKDIQMGQYLYYSELIYECISDMVDFINEKYKV